MKLKILLVALIVSLSFNISAQNYQEVVKGVKESKNVAQLDSICKSVYQATSFNGTPEAVDNIVTQIINTAGVKKSFELKECENIQNAVAKNLTFNGTEKRYIIYDPKWMESMVIKTKSDWVGKLVLAHEIGHHMNGHSMNNGYSTPEKELEADYFAGRALANLGANIEDILVATESMSVNGSTSHPSRADRRAQLTSGFKSVKNKAITLKVAPKNIDEIGLNMVERVRTKLEEGLTRDEYVKTLQVLNNAKKNYYDGKYTEDMRYFEAIIYKGIGEKEFAMNSYKNYLSIENIDNIERIKQLTTFFAEDDKAIAFFTNPKVLFHLSKAYYKNENYDKAISTGKQFLGQTNGYSEYQPKVSQINKLIADSEFEKIFSGSDGLTTEEMVSQGITLFKNNDFPKALDYLTEGSQKGNTEAMNYLAIMYYQGKGVTVDYARAYEWFSKAAGAANKESQYYLGNMYYQGHHVAKNDVDALFWLQKSADANYIKALSLIAEIETQKKSKESKRISDNKVENVEIENNSNETIAMKLIKANDYFEKEMYSFAYENYIEAANNGNAVAQFKIGWMLYKGKGVVKDKDKAYEWWTYSAKQGNIEAINFLTRAGKW